MKKPFTRKPITLLLSLLTVLFVVCCMAFSASAENTEPCEVHTFGEPIYRYTGSIGPTKDSCKKTEICTVCGFESVTTGLVGYSMFRYDRGGDHTIHYINVDGNGMYTAPAGTVVKFTMTEAKCSYLSEIVIEPYTLGDYRFPDTLEEYNLTYDANTGIYSFTVPHYPVFIVGRGGYNHNYEAQEMTDITATCTQPGTCTILEQCKECGARNRNWGVRIPALGHTPGAAAVENFVLPTEEAEGGYDLVTYCAVCEEELSRETVTLEKLAPSGAHVPGTPVVENFVAPSTEQAGGFDIVVYCADCGEELSRESKTIEKVAPPTPDTPDTPAQPAADNVCPWCGQTEHKTMWIGFVHSVFTFVQAIFAIIFPGVGK